MIDTELFTRERVGRPGGPRVVLVHGVLDSHASFDGVADALAPEWSVVTYDRRGWAASAGLPRAESIDAHVDDLLTVVGSAPSVVVGHSYGATVAMAAAVVRPDLVLALGLFEPFMPWVEWWPSPATMAEQRAAEQQHLRAGLDGVALPSAAQRARGQALTTYEMTLVASPPLDFRDLRVPRLVGRGGESVPWRVATTERLGRELSCDVMVVDHAGHTAHRVQPARFAAFVQRVATLAHTSPASRH